MKPINKEEAIIRLRNLCSRSEKCLFDVKKKLLEWEVPEAFEEISKLLLEEKFIDEERYATSFVNDKVRFSKWGFQKVRYHLRSKNIKSATIESAIGYFDKDVYKEILLSEIEKKNRSIKLDDQYKRKQKILAFGAGRGYETNLIYSVISELNI